MFLPPICCWILRLILLTDLSILLGNSVAHAMDTSMVGDRIIAITPQTMPDIWISETPTSWPVRPPVRHWRSRMGVREGCKSHSTSAKGRHSSISLICQEQPHLSPGSSHDLSSDGPTPTLGLLPGLLGVGSSLGTSWLG